MIDVTRYRERFEAELANVVLPEMALIERAMPTPAPLGDIARAVDAALLGIAMPRGRVAVAVGSRGIARLGEFVAAAVAALRRAGCEPFVVPAMGSHGASTAQGQADVLAHLGVTEASVGAPVRATMETVEVGRTPSGLPVYMDTLAYAADAIVPINRVKPHTSFRGPIESGPAKMLAIGLGKQDGARSVHSLGWGGMRESVPAAARVAIATGKIAFALAILENANEQPCRVEAMAANVILDREPALLVEAMANLARLPLDAMDVLVVDRIGKAISGGGGDPNVTGRFPSTYISGGPTVTRLVYCAMAPDGDGNANGVGLADVVTSELAAHVDPLPTYLNALTTTAAGNVRMPMVMPTKRLAVAAALRMCPDLDATQAVVVRVLDTLHLRRMWVSRAALAGVREEFDVLVGFAPAQLEAGFDRL
ncbi:MAG: lactate racemase domain-containing protein [Vulcanimicrobiaceae bacterium]